jgi:hypothetical protein
MGLQCLINNGSINNKIIHAVIIYEFTGNKLMTSWRRRRIDIPKHEMDELKDLMILKILKAYFGVPSLATLIKVKIMKI